VRTPAAETPTPTPSPTAEPDPWTREVGRICAQLQRRSQQAVSGAGATPGGPATVATVLERIGPDFRRAARGLERVKVPSDIRADYRDFVAGIDAVGRLLPSAAEDIRGGRATEEALAPVQRRSERLQPFAAEHGITACLPPSG
jgi:hypothetical protein